MGEATRRKRLGTYAEQTSKPTVSTLQPSQSLISAIALATVAIDRVAVAGPDGADLITSQCWWRNQIIPIAARQFGLSGRVVVGGMFYLAGYKHTDVLVFGDMDARPTLPNLFHVWAEIRDQGIDWLVDITPAHWSSLTDAEADAGLPPITWTATPPDIVVRPRKVFSPRFHGLRRNTPPGFIWYGNESRALRNDVLDQMGCQHDAFEIAVQACLGQFPSAMEVAA